VREEDADALRIDINLQIPHASSGPTTVNQLIEHFLLKEMPQDDHERIIFDQSRIRVLPDQLDLSEVGKHRIGDRGRRSRKLVGDHSAGGRNESENKKHHERRLQSRSAPRVAG
jgi:hypothetical protein